LPAAPVAAAVDEVTTSLLHAHLWALPPVRAVSIFTPHPYHLTCCRRQTPLAKTHIYTYIGPPKRKPEAPTRVLTRIRPDRRARRRKGRIGQCDLCARPALRTKVGKGRRDASARPEGSSSARVVGRCLIRGELVAVAASAG
jgi:hypothetical protein